MKKKEKEFNFEDGLKKLENLVEALEGRTLSLDKAMSSFEEGLSLCQNLFDKLKEAEGKIELLSKDAEGRPTGRAYDLDDGETDAGGDDDDDEHLF